MSTSQDSFILKGTRQNGVWSVEVYAGDDSRTCTHLGSGIGETPDAAITNAFLALKLKGKTLGQTPSLLNFPLVNGTCDDCEAWGPLISKSDHHGGVKNVCVDREGCNRRSPG